MRLWLRMGTVVVLLCGLVIAPAAARADPVAECQAITSNQVETGECLRDTLSNVESVMQRALERAQAKADSVDNVTGRPQARKMLDQSQVAWTQFRDADCQVRGGLAAGGSGSGHFIAGCQIDLTRARTLELNALAGDP